MSIVESPALGSPSVADFAVFGVFGCLPATSADLSFSEVDGAELADDWACTLPSIAVFPIVLRDESGSIAFLSDEVFVFVVPGRASLPDPKIVGS